jgi:hypothetical protein
MTKYNASNERVKRDYFRFLAEAKGRDTATIDRVSKSLARFEADTRYKDFKRFHREQAVAFKRRLGEATSERSGERLSKATLQSTLRDLKAFFEWLAREPGYRSRIEYADADYFNLSEKDTAIARARREKAVPTLDQVRHVLSAMPSATVLQRRDRALVPYYNPHSFRDMLVRHAMTLDLTPEEMKAWSQNIGHSDVLTTFTSYGAVPAHRQAELIRARAEKTVDSGIDDNALLEALARRLKG